MFDLLKQAATDGGEILLKHFQTAELAITDKTDHTNIVTQADTESQELVKNILVAGMKAQGIATADIGFIGEEDLHEVGPHTFIIDPLDGTSNFATGMADFCVLIGYMNDGVLTAGITYFPVTNEIYYAEKGKGASVIRNGEKTQLKSISQELKNTFVFTSLSYVDDIESGLYAKIPTLKERVRAVRMVGCAGRELAYVAEGVAGASILVGCSIWDIAPGLLMLREIGYEMYDWQGNPIKLDVEKPKETYPFIACHPENKEKLLDVFKE